MKARLLISEYEVPQDSVESATRPRRDEKRSADSAGTDLHRSTSPTVRAVGLHKILSDRPVLRDLTFDLPAGGYVALLGANGAGKTTLLRLLSTLTTPTRGQLEIFGRCTRRHGAVIRAGLGLIGHQSMLYRDLSAVENLVFFGRLHDIAQPLVRAMDLLEFVGLADRAHDPVKAFSRGMLQRVSIARALLHEPRLLLADEPFAGLDAPSVRTVERLLRQLNEQGMAIILANHDVQQSLRLAARAMVIKRGRLVLDVPVGDTNADDILDEIERR